MFRSTRPALTETAPYACGTRHAIAAMDAPAPKFRIAAAVRTQPSRPPIPSGFEPVSAETQPVSGRPPIQISDIEKSSSRDSPRDSRVSVRFLENSWRETVSLPSNPRKGRHFRQYPKFPARDAYGWLGIEDSNCDVPNSSPSQNQLQQRP
jgi:hypothetical protein